MSSSAQSTTYHSYSPVKMEGLDNTSGFDKHPGLNVISPNHQFLYLQVLGDTGSPLPPALFNKDVVAGMFITQNMTGTAPETALDILFVGDAEAIIEVEETANIERMIVIMTALQWWLGQKVTLQCRVATRDEVAAARARAEEEEDGHHIPNGNEGDERLIRMMEDIHKLAASPHGEALRIPTFSGVVLPPKNEATFAQWIHEVKQALEKFPETTVRNWISRSLRGPPAEIVRSLGSGVTVQAILQKLEMMHGTVHPFDVMMRRVFNISQTKGENVTQFATKLESAISNVQRDHPMQSAQVNLRNGMRDRFYQGLKKSLKESLRYLYNTGAPYETILVAARTAEAEVENFKETDTASAKSAQGVSSELWDELANIKAVVNKTWNSQQKTQKKDKQGGSLKKADSEKTNKQPPGNKGACFGCGGTGHFIRECPNNRKKSLNLIGGERRPSPPPSDQEERSSNCYCYRGTRSGRRGNPRGWARTGLEPETTMNINCLPYNAIVYIGSSLSMIYVELCERMCEWCSVSKWYEDECSDDLYDFDNFEEENPLIGMTQLAKRVSSPVSSLSGSWSDIIGLFDLECEEDLAEVEPQEKEKPLGKVTNEKQGILDSGMESEGEACSAPSARAGPPPKKEEANPKGGDDQSVFTSLTKELKNTAEEVSDPTCNIEDSADSDHLTVKLSPFPTVSCRITPTGETILSFQWEPQSK